MYFSKRVIFDFVKDPVRLSFVSVFLFFVLLITFGSIQWIGEMGMDRTPWLLSASTILLFSIFNAVFLLFSNDLLIYWQRSMYSYMGLALTTGLLAWLISGLSLGEIGNFRSVLIVLVLSYIVFLIIVTMVRRIVEYSRKRDREKLDREQIGQTDENL